jgi:hypothetical protein|tara:strand:- start:125 stop:379 length:255 start_codon:yes stop_codon:yes gene_type:complete
MTYEERTNIESYLENLNNLVQLKKALKRSLDRVEGDIEFSMFQIEEQTDDDSFASKPLNPLRSYQDIMQGVIEDLLPCWKVAIK